MLALGLWLFLIHPESRLHQAFALFLALRGGLNISAGLVIDADPAYLASRMSGYFSMALPSAALYLLVVYLRRYGRTRPWEGWPWLLLVAGIALELLYLGRHDLWYPRLLRAPWSVPQDVDAPLMLVVAASQLCYTAIALVLGRESMRVQGQARARSLRVAALGFAFNPVLVASLLGAALLLPRVGLPGPAVENPYVRLIGVSLPIAVALMLVGWWTAAARGSKEDRRWARTAALLLLLPAASALVVLLLVVKLPGAAGVPAALADALWTLPMPVLVAYALLRHHFLDIDVRLRWTVRSGALAAPFLAVLLVVSQLAENLLNQSLGLLVGGVAAGLLLFALQPLGRLADRVASGTMRHAGPVSGLSAGLRRDLYREQVRVAWSDGHFTRKERRMLDVARSKLRLSAADALDIEGRVARQPGA